MGSVQKEGSKEGAETGGRMRSLLRSRVQGGGGFVLLTHGASWG